MVKMANSLSQSHMQKGAKGEWEKGEKGQERRLNCEVQTSTLKLKVTVIFLFDSGAII